MLISDLSKVGGSSAWVGFLDSAGLAVDRLPWLLNGVCGGGRSGLSPVPPPLFLSPPPPPGVPSPFYWVRIDLGNGGEYMTKGVSHD